MPKSRVSFVLLILTLLVVKSFEFFLKFLQYSYCCRANDAKVSYYFGTIFFNENKKPPKKVNALKNINSIIVIMSLAKWRTYNLVFLEVLSNRNNSKTKHLLEVLKARVFFSYLKTLLLYLSFISFFTIIFSAFSSFSFGISKSFNCRCSTKNLNF